MKLDEIKKVAVLGSGTMGAQIAEVCSRLCEYEVHMADTSDELVRKGLQSIEERLERFFVSKGRMTAAEKQATMNRIRGNSSLEEAVSDIDFVIEAVPEVLSIKREIFKKLDENAPKAAILASNTSTLNITEIASVTKRPDKVVGMHFFNPVAMMKLVEVVKGANTSDETVEVVKEMCYKLGKEPVVCRDTSYGFLANRAYDTMRMEVVQNGLGEGGLP